MLIYLELMPVAASFTDAAIAVAGTWNVNWQRGGNLLEWHRL
jgi:hypothetical protein